MRADTTLDHKHGNFSYYILPASILRLAGEIPDMSSKEDKEQLRMPFVFTNLILKFCKDSVMLSPPYHPPVLALFFSKMGRMHGLDAPGCCGCPTWMQQNSPVHRLAPKQPSTYPTNHFTEQCRYISHSIAKCLEFHQTQNKFYKIPLPASTSSHAWWSSFLGPRPDRTHCICHATLMNASCKLSTELRHDDIRS